MLLLASTTVFAYSDGDSNFKGLFSIGLNAGNEDLANFSDGSSLTSAGLFSFSAGITYNVPSSDFEIQAAVGYAFDSVEAVQGTFKFNKTSIEIIPFYRVTDATRIGLGLYSVMSARYSDPLDSVTFGIASGTVFEVNWQLTTRASWGIRYVDIDLPFETFNGFDVSASGITVDGSYVGFQYYGHF